MMLHASFKLMAGNPSSILRKGYSMLIPMRSKSLIIYFYALISFLNASSKYKRDWKSGGPGFNANLSNLTDR